MTGGQPDAFVAGVRLRPAQDYRWAAVTGTCALALVLMGLTLSTRWHTLTTCDPNGPIPALLLCAMPVFLIWYWIRAFSERAKLRAVAAHGDSEVLTIAVRSLYRGLFIAAMICAALDWAIDRVTR